MTQGRTMGTFQPLTSHLKYSKYSSQFCELTGASKKPKKNRVTSNPPYDCTNPVHAIIQCQLIAATLTEQQ